MVQTKAKRNRLWHAKETMRTDKVPIMALALLCLASVEKIRVKATALLDKAARLENAAAVRDALCRSQAPHALERHFFGFVVARVISA